MRATFETLSCSNVISINSTVLRNVARYGQRCEQLYNQKGSCFCAAAAAGAGRAVVWVLSCGSSKLAVLRAHSRTSGVAVLLHWCVEEVSVVVEIN